MTFLSMSLCAQQWHTTIDVLRPARKPLPTDFNDLLVVNNALAQPADFGHANLRDNKNLENSTIDLEQATTNFLFPLTEILEQQGPYREVGLLLQTQNHSTSFYFAEPLTQQQTKRLCEQYSADALLVLNQLIVYDKQENFLTADNDYFAYLQVFVTANLTLQYPSGKQQQLNYTDTLLWDSYGDTRYEALQGLPPRRDALLDAVSFVAERYAAQFVEQWETVDRYMYDDGSDALNTAFQQFRRRRFEQAIAGWMRVYEQTEKARKRKEKTRHAYAAADIAVTLELQDNLALAREWAELAAEGFADINTAEGRQQRINMQYYIEQLNKRLTDEKKLY